jgi:acyl-CoA thioesterase-1
MASKGRKTMIYALSINRSALWQKPWLVLGDSISKGVAFDPLKKRYQQLKNSFVERIKSDLRLDVMNLSVFGATVEKGLKQLDRYRDRLTKGGVALLHFGGNDCNFNWADISRDPKAEHLPQIPLKNFIHLYEQLIDNLQRQNYQPLLLNLPPLIQDRFFATISRDLDADVILNWLGGTTDSIFKWHKSYSDAVEQLADKKKIPLIDIRSAFLQQPDRETLMCDDGMHPNAKGHALITQIMEANS